MKATIKIENAYGINRTHREREEKNGLAHGYKAITIQDGKPVDLVDLRIAYTNGGTAYACIWIYRPRTAEREAMWSNGSGQAGGCGCDKGSAAAGMAIRKAGVALSEDIGARGKEAVAKAVQAIGEALTDGPVYTVEMYA